MAVMKINGGPIEFKQDLYCLAHYNEKRGWRIVPSTGAGATLEKLSQLAFEWIRERDSWFAAGDHITILNAADLSQSEYEFNESMDARMRRGLFWIDLDSDMAKWLHPDLLKEQVKVIQYSHHCHKTCQDIYQVQSIIGGGVILVPARALVSENPYEPKPQTNTHSKPLRILQTQEEKQAAKKAREVKKAELDKKKADTARASVLGQIHAALDEKTE